MKPKTKVKLSLPAVRNILLFIITVLVAGGIGYSLGQKKLNVNPASIARGQIVNTDVPASQDVDFSLFWDVWSRLERNYIDKSELDSQKMVYGAIAGMVASLGDPYTVFLPPVEQKEAKEELGGTFEGIGAQLGMKDGRIIVVAPLADMPAEKAGILAGDWIVKVNDEDTNGWTVPEAVNKIRGEKGSQVLLTILHESDQETKEISITRGEILVKSVELISTHWKEENGKYVRDDACSSCPMVSYLRLSRFGDQTSSEWARAVSDINTQVKANQTKGVVLDLRNNPGGYLQGAVFIASEFLKNGQVVVQQEYHDGNKETYSVTRQGSLLDVPLVVLINKGSASASEIVAGALRDYTRATLVGEKSFGKGSIQEAQDLPGGSGLHVTIAKWLLPKGDWIHKKGVDPDVKILLDPASPELDTQLEEAANRLIKS